MNDKNITVKECPFCGSDMIYTDESNGLFTVYCWNCECQSGQYKSLGTAIEKWNMRADISDKSTAKESL